MKTKKYQLGSFKGYSEGEFATEEEAIKALSDRYMTASKSHAPGDSFLELLRGCKNREVDKIGKNVYLKVYEDVHGIPQWVVKYSLIIHPFKQVHWWPSSKEPFEFTECDFRDEIAPIVNQSV